MLLATSFVHLLLCASRPLYQETESSGSGPSLSCFRICGFANTNDTRWHCTGMLLFSCFHVYSCCELWSLCAMGLVTLMLLLCVPLIVLFMSLLYGTLSQGEALTSSLYAVFSPSPSPVLPLLFSFLVCSGPFSSFLSLLPHTHTYSGPLVSSFHSLSPPLSILNCLMLRANDASEGLFGIEQPCFYSVFCDLAWSCIPLIPSLLSPLFPQLKEESFHFCHFLAVAFASSPSLFLGFPSLLFLLLSSVTIRSILSVPSTHCPL